MPSLDDSVRSCGIALATAYNAPHLPMDDDDSSFYPDDDEDNDKDI
jgi:hypothetical protein